MAKRERIRLDRKSQPPKDETQKEGRAAKNATAFTERTVQQKPFTKSGRELWWDSGSDGLYLLISSKSKTFRSQFKLHGKWHTRKLAAYGELIIDDSGQAIEADVLWARQQVKLDRAKAEKGIDPRKKDRPASGYTSDKPTFEAVVDRFIELRAKPRQRTWKQTERVLKIHCAGWLQQPFADISRGQAQDLLDGIIAKGHGPKARITLAWLRTLWDWAWKRDLVASPIMQKLDLSYEARVRDRFFSDDELRSIWRAAEYLEELERSRMEAANIDFDKQKEFVAERLRQARAERDYIKLLLLLAPRKTALAGMRRSEFDDANEPAVWTTPHERTKSKKTATRKRVYLTPLPSLAQRIIKGMPKDDMLFPGPDGNPFWPGTRLSSRLVKAGAPKDFNYHAARHTVATWLQNAGHSEFDRGLILNHSASGVTSGYSHGYPLELKRQLLDKWAAHVEGLVSPKGVALLR